MTGVDRFSLIAMSQAEAEAISLNEGEARAKLEQERRMAYWGRPGASERACALYDRLEVLMMARRAA